MRKAYKSIISLAVVLIAGLNYIVPAFAQDPFTAVAVGGLTGASGAGLFSSMASASGVNLQWGNNSIDDIDALWDVTNPNHVYFSGEKHEATNIGEDVFDYIQVNIGDWLNAQSNFISNLIDDNNIVDNDSGNINGTLSIVLGVDATLENNTYYTTPIQIPASVGTYNYGLTTIDVVDNGYKEFYFNYLQNRVYLYSGQVGCRVRLSQDYNSDRVYIYFSQGSGWNNRGYVLSSTLPKNNQYNVNWSSQTINKNVFNDWDNARVKIPKSISQLQSGWTLQDFLEELDRIWHGAGEDNIIIEDGGDIPPIPPVPVPSTPLGEVPFDDWVDLWGQGIYEQLYNQSDALDFIGSNGEDAVEELESIDSNLGDIKEDTGSIDTNIGIGNGLLGGIKSASESAVEYLEGIAEHVEELVEEIVEGTETLIAGILNQIPSVFGVIFGPIKQASSIWHYVVEWMQSISAPMTWVWSMAYGTSYNIVLPVYATLAGAVVLAFYKRFGK